MIMAITHLGISGGEWVCRGCGAPIAELADGSTGIEHPPGCPEAPAAA